MSSQRTIFEVIRDDHETQRTLVASLTEAASEGRAELWPRLKRELHAHAGAEERFFYVPLMEHDMTQEAARHSVAEHQELDDLIGQLDRDDMSGPEWLQTARRLAERLNHHLDEEETDIYPIAGRVLTDAEKTSLGSEYVEDMERRRNDG
mgnify:FL=1